MFRLFNPFVLVTAVAMMPAIAGASERDESTMPAPASEAVIKARLAGVQATETALDAARASLVECETGCLTPSEAVVMAFAALACAVEARLSMARSR